MTAPRPVLRYYGGKWRLAPWIVGHFPEHRIYTEAFGGAASVLLRKSRAYAEVYNDLDGEVVNLFRVLRNPAQAGELIRLIELTPFSRLEFEASYLADDDPIEQARRTMFRSFAGFGSNGVHRNTGFRANTTRAGTIPAHDWRNMPHALSSAIERLRGVVIEHDKAATVLVRYDSPETLHYVDPPYPHSTRAMQSGAHYRHEMTDDDHRELATVLRGLHGMVIVSGYACDLYDFVLYPDWTRIERAAHADGARERTEVLWISPNAAIRPQLFAR
jgi:DNA adenine methylase